MRCPRCDRVVNSRMVAKTVPIELGLLRRRFCECGAEVTTIERVLDADIQGLLVEGLEGHPHKRGSCPGTDRALVSQLVRRLGGSVTSLDT